MYIRPEVTMRVAKWGNSLAVRLPAALVAEMELKTGDEVDLKHLGARTFGVAKLADRQAALKRLEEFRGTIPAGFKFSREEANER
jgi:antitoxin MazE